MKPDRIHLVYDLTFETPFHCGTGIREGLIDRTIVRDGQGYLYIPGSTFKGVLRERCEQLARFFDQPDIASPHDERAALLRLGERQSGMVTCIFGLQNHPGQLFFDDAHQSEEDRREYTGGHRQGFGAALSAGDAGSPRRDDRQGRSTYKSLQVTVSTQVRLDRPTRTAVDKALYTSEFGTSDLAFRGVIQGWLDCRPIPTASAEGPTPTYSLLLLLAGLRLMDRLGGNKSTGKGRCVCAIDTFTLNTTTITRKQWEGWLECLDDLAKYRKEAQS